MATVVEDPEAGHKRLSDAMPTGWYAGHLAVDINTRPRRGYPSIQYRCEFMWGVGLVGGPDLYGDQSRTCRRVAVRASGTSIDDLIRVANLLPSLEALGALPWPVEFDISGWTD